MSVDAVALPGLLPELEIIRADFPILERVLSGGRPLVYLDTTLTGLDPAGGAQAGGVPALSTARSAKA